MKTNVKFLVHYSLVYDEELFAFFPDELHVEVVDETTAKGKLYLMRCYSHIGQHSACHIDYANESREATKEEYNPLLEELLSIGYELNILNKDK